MRFLSYLLSYLRWQPQSQPETVASIDEMRYLV